MTTDLPDFYRKVVIAFDGGFVGLGELAVRLGSIVPWDLMGNVILMEDFAYGQENWTATVLGAGSEVERSAERYLSKGYGMKLTSGDVAGAYAAIGHWLPFRTKSKMALYCCIAWDHDCPRWQVSASPDLKGDQAFIDLRYTVPTQALEINDVDQGWVTIDPAFQLASSKLPFVPIILEFDVENSNYGIVKVGHYEYDCSDYGFRAIDNLSDTHLGVAIWNYAHGGVGGIIFVDNIVVVENRP